jgi:hypothetical protein
MNAMGAASKFTILVLCCAILFALGVSYYRIFISKDYLVAIEVDCDALTEACYEYTDEESGEVSYYKTIEKPAYALPHCEPSDADCLSSIICAAGEPKCTITYCDATLGEACESE